MQTSSSKKPERSRDEAIPISWKALIWVGFSCADSSIGFKNKKSKVSFNEYETEGTDYWLLYHVPKFFPNCVYLFDWENWTRK
jgi:hypothetical protein